MEIQTKPIFHSPTPRVKCITGHPNYPDVIVCLYTGEIRIFDPKTYTVKKSAQICESPIRTAVIVPTKDWIFVGTDEGKVLALDLGNLSVIDTIQAHDDFIRKIVVDEVNSRFITVSDDNRTKLWCYKNGFTMINKYKDAKHFVMDVAFLPNDPNHFLTVCLDKKIRMYSVTNTKMIKQYKGHESGINSISFINQDTFITASDDCTLMAWDMRRPMPITVLKGHSKTVNMVQNIKNGFASCSEDNTVRIWNKDFKSIEILTLQSRVWSLYMKGTKIIVGTDDEVVVFDENSSSAVARLCDSKVFYNTGNVLNCTKCEEIGAFKELGNLEADFETFKLNSNGKTIAILGNNKISVSSVLGLRKKYSDEGKDLIFIDNERFVYLKDSTLVFVNKTEIENSIEVEGIARILFADSEFIIGNSEKNCFVYANNDSLDVLHKFDCIFNDALMLNGSFVLFNDQINVFDRNFKKIESFEIEVEHSFVNDGVLYVSTPKKSFYLMIDHSNAYLFPLKPISNIIGVKNDLIFYFSNGIKSETIDISFISFKKDYFEGKNPKVIDAFREKAIVFFELIGLHEKALSLATDENQKFEILIKLGRHEEALKTANSPIKFEKLGKKFFSMGQLGKAADCYAKSDDLNSLFLIDLFGNRKYLDFVVKKARDCGKNNLALLAAYKNEDFETCKVLLKNTPFYQTFNKFYCD